MDDQLPYFGGAAGEPVPQVDPEDIKAAWKVGRDIESRHSGGPGLHAYAIGVEVFKAACKPGANIPAVCYRGMMLGVLTRHAQEQVSPWLKEGKPESAIHLYNEAIETDPYYTPAYLGLAHLYTVAEDRQDAIETLERILKYDPGNELARKAITDAKRDAKE